MIIDKHKTIFIHIPKTAGTSVNSYFSQDWKNRIRIQSDKHATVHEIKKKFPNAYKNYSKFSIVNKPFESALSIFIAQSIVFSNSSFCSPVN